MEALDLEKLRALIALCRETGVAAVEACGVRLQMGPPPPPVQEQPGKVKPAEAAPATPNSVKGVEQLEARLMGVRRFAGEVLT